MSCCCGHVADRNLLLAVSSQKTKEAESFEKRWNLNLRETAAEGDFHVFRTVGLGAFGRVFYVKHKKNKHDYAMKTMKKEKIVRMEQVNRVFLEKRILQSVVHPFLTNLRFVFKTNSYLHIVMPFVRGGEIFSYLRSMRMFSERQTRFYSGQIILALQYLHGAGIVYRDLKPENVLLECDGYIRITDYGFSKRLEGQKTTVSFVGTPEYMAPEMLVRSRRLRGYSYSVDWWSLGVFIYESAAGMPPFLGSSLLQVFDNIVKGQYQIPDHFGAAMADLVQKLFLNDVGARIGCRASGAEELKAHEWFSDMNWQALIEKKVPSEFVPNCTVADVTSNFDLYYEEPLEQATDEEYVEEFKNF